MNVLPESRRARLILGVLTAVLLLAIGAAGSYLVQSYSRPGDSSADAGFARDMITHHDQAVEMAMWAYQKSDDYEIQQLGYDIATTQQAQVGIMQTWLSDWDLTPTSTAPHMSWMPAGERTLQPSGLMPGMASDAQLTQLHAATGKAFNVLFCQLMLRHHLGGVHMAQEGVALSTQSQVKVLAQQMVNTQQLEITTLENKLKSLGAQPLGS